MTSSIEDDFDSDSTIVGEHSLADVTQRATKLAHLEQRRGPGAPQTFQLDRAETVIGRAPSVDISIVSSLLSRRHVALKKTGGQVLIEDLDSVNGMYLNGVKAHSAILHEGDQVQIGDVVLTFHEGE